MAFRIFFGMGWVGLYMSSFWFLVLWSGMEWTKARKGKERKRKQKVFSSNLKCCHEDSCNNDYSHRFREVVWGELKSLLALWSGSVGVGITSGSTPYWKSGIQGMEYRVQVVNTGEICGWW